MSSFHQGLLAGLLFGGLTVATLLPVKTHDRRTLLLVAFLNRFGIGLVIPFLRVPLPGWLTGLLASLVLSLPAVITTKAARPILFSGAIGGVVIGAVTLSLR